MRYPIFPAGAFIAAFLVLVPAFWHWRARNVPTVSLIVWLFILNVVCGANSLAWSDDIRDKAPVWCNICEFFARKATRLTHPNFVPQPLNSSLELRPHYRRAPSAYASTSPWLGETKPLDWITKIAEESCCLTLVSAGGFQ